MIRGIESFRKWFQGCEEQYVIIGGTACDLLMTNEGLDFRATKDIDLVLVIEALDVSFGKRFWEYIVAAGYEHRNKSTEAYQFYRFSKPQLQEYPAMIELFTRKPDTIILPRNAILTPLPLDENISSLSAILLDDDYYNFLMQGRTKVAGVTVLDVTHLIAFKAKAWLELSERNVAFGDVDSRDIKKHKNDVFRLTELLYPDQEPLRNVPLTVLKDMRTFLEKMETEDVDLIKLRIPNKTKDTILEELRSLYGLD